MMSEVHRTKWSVRVSLLLYGLLVAAAGVFWVLRAIPGPAVLMETRANSIAGSLYVLDRGGPPLVVTSDTFDKWPSGGPANLQPVAVADDQGLFLYVPLLGHFIGNSDPFYVIKIFFLILFVPLLVAYPLLIYEALGSAVSGLIAPWLLLVGTRFTWNSELYYAPAWAALACLPCLVLAHRRWSERWARGLLFFAIVMGGLATTVRFHAGLAALLAAIGIILVRVPRWRLRTIYLLAAVFLYIGASESTVLAQRYRDAQLGVNLTDRYPTHHASWHGAYIGLGYLPNPYGIRFDDGAGAATAQSLRPGVAFGSTEYEDVLRQAVLEIIMKNPIFVIQTLAAKAGVTVFTVPFILGGLLAFVPVAMLFGKRRRMVRAAGLISAPFLLVNFAAPVLYVPYTQYQLGWLSTWATLGIICGAALSADVAAVASNPGRLRRVGSLVTSPGAWRRQFERLLRWRHLRLAVVAATALAVLVTVVGIKVAEVGMVGYYRQVVPVTIDASLPGDLVYARTFGSALPEDWAAFGGVTLDLGASGLIVHTNNERLAYQLWSAPQTLAPGDYVLSLGGKVIDGGLYVGVLDTAKKEWVATGYFWFGSNLESGQIGTRLHVVAPLEVRLVLSNWRPLPGSSTWSLNDIALKRITAAGAP